MRIPARCSLLAYTFAVFSVLPGCKDRRYNAGVQGIEIREMNAFNKNSVLTESYQQEGTRVVERSCPSGVVSASACNAGRTILEAGAVEASLADFLVREARDSAAGKRAAWESAQARGRAAYQEALARHEGRAQALKILAGRLNEEGYRNAAAALGGAATVEGSRAAIEDELKLLEAFIVETRAHLAELDKAPPPPASNALKNVMQRLASAEPLSVVVDLTKGDRSPGLETRGAALSAAEEERWLALRLVEVFREARERLPQRFDASATFALAPDTQASILKSPVVRSGNTTWAMLMRDETAPRPLERLAKPDHLQWPRKDRSERYSYREVRHEWPLLPRADRIGCFVFGPDWREATWTEWKTGAEALRASEIGRLVGENFVWLDGEPTTYASAFLRAKLSAAALAGETPPADSSLPARSYKTSANGGDATFSVCRCDAGAACTFK